MVFIPSPLRAPVQRKGFKKEYTFQVGLICDIFNEKYIFIPEVR